MLRDLKILNKNIFAEFTWPSKQRGTHAVIGVATSQAPLHSPGVFVLALITKKEAVHSNRDMDTNTFCIKTRMTTLQATNRWWAQPQTPGAGTWAGARWAIPEYPSTKSATIIFTIIMSMIYSRLTMTAQNWPELPTPPPPYPR